VPGTATKEESQTLSNKVLAECKNRKASHSNQSTHGFLFELFEH